MIWFSKIKRNLNIFLLYYETKKTFSNNTSIVLWLYIGILCFCNFRLNNIWFENRCKIYLIILTIFSVMSFYIFENRETNICYNGILMSYIFYYFQLVKVLCNLLWHRINRNKILDNTTHDNWFLNMKFLFEVNWIKFSTYLQNQ